MVLDPRYAAGFFDGEGCVMVSAQVPYGRATTITHSLVVTISNTVPGILPDLHRTWGGNLRRVLNVGPGRKTYYQWTVKDRRAADVLRWMLPHLVVKKDQALLGIEFQEHKSNGTYVTRGKGVPTSPEALALREHYRQALQAEKARVY